MGEPTYRPLTGEDLWLASDTLPGLLDGWCGPVSLHGGTGWYDASIIDDNGGGDPRVVGYYHGSGGYTVSEYERAAGLRLDCRRPEVQARLADVLAGMGHDIDTLLSARRHGRLPNVEAAALVWCSALRVVAGLGPIVGGCSFDDGEEGDHHEALALAYAIREPDALLLPLPGGVIGRLEVSDG